MVEANVKISKKKNGPKNVFLNTKGTKKIINVKVKSERERGRDCAYECMRDAEKERVKGKDMKKLNDEKKRKKLRAKEQSRNWRAIISDKLIPVDDNQRNKRGVSIPQSLEEIQGIFMQQSSRRSKS